MIPTRDVNGAGRVRVVVPPYHTRSINIRPVLVPISVMCVPAYFFHIRGYPLTVTRGLQNYLKTNI